MSITDPIADLCTRIRNAVMRKHPNVSAPYSSIKANVSNVLKEEGFITDWSLEEGKSFNNIVINLKYDKNGESVVRKIVRVSKPGLRINSGVKGIQPVFRGQGISIVTTSKGVLSDRECRRQHVGGEILCQVW